LLLAEGSRLTDRKDKTVNDTPNRGLHQLAIILCCMTVVLLVAGALVTSNEAGDSVPDWPLSFGRWLIRSNNFIANVRYEYSHRFIAGLVGFTTLTLAVWTYFGERRDWMRRLGLVAFAGVVAQAIIGGMRVWFPEHKALIAVPHALVAQSFFAVAVSIVVFTSRSWVLPRQIKSDERGLPLRALTGTTVLAVLIQLVLGAGFRHQAFGIAPHVVGAVVVTLLIAITATTVLRRHRENTYLARPAKFVIALLIIQLGLGIGAYLARLASAGDAQPLEPMISLTVAHLVVGALTLAMMVTLTLRCHQVLARARQPVSGAVESHKIHSASAV
jgi:cytochrome c oxidase assembly protein subunit 15